MLERENLMQLRQDLVDFRKNSVLPYWRIAYVEFLLNRAEECLAVERAAEASGLLEKARKWFEQNRLQPSSATRAGESDSEWDTPLIHANLQRLRQDLQRKKHLVPAPERESFQQGLQRVERLLSHQKIRDARQELDGVRTHLIRRLQRSYRARAKIAPLIRDADGQIRTWTRPARSALLPVGPYNNQQTLDEVCQLVEERDPIWVEDFMELYNSLLGYTERLGIGDKNLRKPSKGG